MPKKARTVWKSANVPLKDYTLIKDWVDSGESPYTSVEEAYRDAIRDILFGRVYSVKPSE